MIEVMFSALFGLSLFIAWVIGDGTQSEPEAITITNRILILVVFCNCVSFILMWHDKRQAEKKKSRVPNAFLLFFVIIGGPIGTILGMYCFRHKTLKTSFQMWVLINTMLWILVMALSTGFLTIHKNHYGQCLEIFIWSDKYGAGILFGRLKSHNFWNFLSVSDYHMLLKENDSCEVANKMFSNYLHK